MHSKIAGMRSRSFPNLPVFETTTGYAPPKKIILSNTKNYSRETKPNRSGPKDMFQILAFSAALNRSFVRELPRTVV